MIKFTISHSINLPSSFTCPDQSPPPSIDTFEYPLDLDDTSHHLESLEKQLGIARNDFNKRLTEWKGLLKDFEKEDNVNVNKKNKNKKKDDDQDEEEDVEDEDDQVEDQE
jgi:hypothetical protein